MSRWAGRRERGHPVIAWLVLRIALSLGWRKAHVLLYPIVLFYLIGAPEARRASRFFLRRALDRPVRIRDTKRHFLTFAEVLLDRLFLVAGETAGFRLQITGLDALREQLGRGRGCLLLSAHLGSFEALRAFGHTAPVRAHALMRRADAGPYTAFLDAANPKLLQDVITLEEPDAMLRVQEALQRGEIVGMLADRAPREERSIEVPFFGRPALFPSGPIIVAAALQASVMLTFCPRVGQRAYAIEFVPFADRMSLPRPQRSEALADWVGRFAAALEAQVRAAPYNWFNFYDFWNEAGPLAAADARVAGRRPVGRLA